MRDKVIAYLKSRNWDGPLSLRLILLRIFAHEGPLVGLTHIGGETIGTLDTGEVVYMPGCPTKSVAHDMVLICKRAGLTFDEAMEVIAQAEEEFPEHAFRPLREIHEEDADEMLVRVPGLLPGRVF